MHEKLTHKTAKTFENLYKNYSAILIVLLVLQIVTYSYFFTSLIFTNHTFPNSWLYPYPSFKTQGEGRWMADIIIWIQGGSGVQPFQMYIAATLQAINGILFAIFIGTKKRFETFIVAAFLCLYPAFLDNYSFSIDHITFAIGDTLALIGIMYCQSKVHSIKNALIAILFFVLSLASYQPKIAFIGFLCIAYLLIEISGNDEIIKKHVISRKDALNKILFVCCIFIGSIFLYFISIKLTITSDIGQRTNISTITEMITTIFGSYSSFLRYYIDSDYLPEKLRFLPTISILLGCFTIIYKAHRKQIKSVSIVIIMLLLIPIVLQASYVININTWKNAGRITFVYGYSLIFFLSFAMKLQGLKNIMKSIIVLFLYFFVVIGTQESNAAAIKTTYDLNMINRITSRIEVVAEELYQKQHALVVIGHYPDFDRTKYIRHPNDKNRPHVSSFAFEGYRQSAIINYFLGRDVLEQPSSGQIKRAILSSKDRLPYPARDSVYVLDDDLIVVLLEKYSPESSLTWPLDRKN